MANESTRPENEVTTGKVRLSYTHLFEPSSNVPGQDKKYSTVLLIPKTEKLTIKKLRDAQQLALQEGKTKVFGGKIPRVWKDTIHDGDEEADLEKNPEYAGCFYMSVSSKTQPVIVDRMKLPITDPMEVYSGCYARVVIRAFAFDQAGNKGVSFGLNAVQKLADGESFGAARVDPDAVFDDLDDDDDALI